MPLWYHTNDGSEPMQVTVAQPVNDDDDHKEGKDVHANWCNEDASDDDTMVPHFCFDQL